MVTKFCKLTKKSLDCIFKSDKFYVSKLQLHKGFFFFGKKIRSRHSHGTSKVNKGI